MSKEVKCLEASTGSCQGQVALRESLTGTGQPIADVIITGTAPRSPTADD